MVQLTVVRVALATKEVDVGGDAGGLAATTVASVTGAATAGEHGGRFFDGGGRELQSQDTVAGMGDGALLLMLPADDGIQSACNDDRVLASLARALGRPPTPPPMPAPRMAQESLTASEDALAKLDSQNQELKLRLGKSEQARLESTAAVKQLRAKFEQIVEEIMAENRSLIKAAERSVEIGYQHKPSRMGATTAMSSTVDGRMSAAGSFRSSKGMSYGLASDLPGGKVDGNFNVARWDLPK
eukprot:COSAG01_NODE_1948_length_8825_cov_9.036214_3_plen_242_part_00